MVAVTQREKGSGVVECDDGNRIPPFFIGCDRFIALRPSKVINRLLGRSHLLTIWYQPICTSYRGPPSYVTVIAVDSNNQITESWLRRTLEIHRLSDDVFRDDFLSGVIFTGVASEASLKVSPAATKLLKSLGNSWVQTFDTHDQDDAPPPGPYVTDKNNLLEVFRLYDDIQGAFMNGLIWKPES